MLFCMNTLFQCISVVDWSFLLKTASLILETQNIKSSTLLLDYDWTKDQIFKAVLTGLVTFLNVGAMIIARGVIFPPEERPPGVRLVPEGMILRSTYPSLPIFHVFINNITAQVLYSIILCFMSSLTPSLQSFIIRCDTAGIYFTHIHVIHIFIVTVRALMDPHNHQMRYCKHL